MAIMTNISIPIFWSYRIFSILFMNLKKILSIIYIVPTIWLISQINKLCWVLFFYVKFSILLHYKLAIYFSKLFTLRDSRIIQLHIYKLMPTRTTTKLFGKIARINLPVFIRAPVYFVYSKMFGVNLKEVERPLGNYPSLSSFFTRRLKKTVRRIENSSAIYPCDGTIVHYGKLNKTLHGVKGVDYDVCEFLGHIPKTRSIDSGNPTTLFHCIIYLAPGDYHRFHSPCDWVVFERDHFPGKLLSVSPKIVRWFPGLLSSNERVVYTGHWKYGYFSYVLVGATNVGSVVVHKDPLLNMDKRVANVRTFDTPLVLSKGEEVGYFAMGSTIVLIFEAPTDFKFTCGINDKIQMGKKLTLIK